MCCLKDVQCSMLSQSKTIQYEKQINWFYNSTVHHIIGNSYKTPNNWNNKIC